MIDHPSISKARHGSGPRTKRKALARRQAIEEARRADRIATRVRNERPPSDVYDIDIIHRPFVRPGDPGWTR